MWAGWVWESSRTSFAPFALLLTGMARHFSDSRFWIWPLALMPHSCGTELAQRSSLIAVPSMVAPPALYRHSPPNRSDPSRPRVTCCEVEVVHPVEMAEPPLTARHLPATPEVTGLAGIVHAWLRVKVHGCAVSCVLFVVLELGSVMQSPVAGLTIAPA